MYIYKVCEKFTFSLCVSIYLCVSTMSAHVHAKEWGNSED